MSNHMIRYLTVVASLVLLGGTFPAAAGDVIPTMFLHGTGSPPQTVFLDTVAPSAAAPKFKDSASVAFSGGNPWKEIGTWTTAPGAFTGTVDGLNDLRVYVGLKNSDDEGTRFGIRAEAYKNGFLLTSGQIPCIAEVTRNPDKTKEVIVSLGAFPQDSFAAGDVLSVRVFTRIGTTATGAFCGGHASASGLRLYFDAFTDPSQLALRTEWNTGIGGTPDRKGLSPALGPIAPSILWQGGIPAIFGQQSVIEDNIVVSTRSEDFGAEATWIAAQNLSTGAELWRTKLPINFSDSWYSRVSAMRGGQVYATRAGNTNLEYLYALSAADGSVLWRSQDLIDEYGGNSPSFAPNGDPIVGNSSSITRINHVDGTTVWNAVCACNGLATAVSDRVYAWDYDFGNSGFVVAAFDITSGNKLYFSAALPFGMFPSGNALVAGSHGRIYAGTSTPALFVSLSDTGSALVAKWRIPMADTSSASFGIGPDGSVYTYSPSNQILQLDPVTGHVRNTSTPIPSFGGGLYGPRMAIDSSGRVFLTADAAIGGTLYSFNADLTVRWSTSVPNVNVGGPALGNDGTLVVNGVDVRAYRTP